MQSVRKILFVPSPNNFNLMVLGQIVSVLGSSILRFALSLYVLDITGRADLFAALYAISSVPLLLAPLGGAIADRFNRRNLMVMIDFANSAVVLCFFIVMLSGNASVISIGVVMVLLSVINSIESPTVTACIPLLVEESKLEQSNGIVQAVQALSGVAAPVIGGILYGVIGINALVVMSFAAFFIAAIMEIFIKIPFVKRKQEGHIAKTIARDMKDGFIFVITQPFILKAVILAALLNLILTPLFIVGGPIVLRVTMQSSDVMYGLGMGFIQFATILGALTVGFFAKKMKMNTLYRPMLIGSLLLIPMALSITPITLNMGYYPAFILFMSGAIPIAAMVTIISIFAITKVQKKTPNENLGKVMAIIMAVAQCAAPLGQIIYGVVFEAFSETLYLPLLAVSFLMLAVTGISYRMLRNEGE